MDNNYLYIVGVLGILLVAFIVFYYLQKRSKSLENIETSKIEENIQDEHQDVHQDVHQVECGGDKCFIKHRQTKYDKCDD
jgi:regulatory protein YycI of two-component signal transduction system YycFG